jgi:Ca2+-transporting ATPase
MASFYRMDGHLVAHAKGAPRQILALSGRGPAGERLDEERRQALTTVNDELARAGLRVLGLATGRVEAPTEAALRDLTFVGFIGLMDPPAPHVRQTIERLRGAGLRTVMLTGDQRLTAEAVGRDLRLLSRDAEIADGRQLDAMPSDELASRVTRIGAFSRITPEHKLRIVTALQARGHIVAILGDV